METEAVDALICLPVYVVTITWSVCIGTRKSPSARVLGSKGQDTYVPSV